MYGDRFLPPLGDWVGRYGDRFLPPLGDWVERYGDRFLPPLGDWVDVCITIQSPVPSSPISLPFKMYVHVCAHI